MGISLTDKTRTICAVATAVVSLLCAVVSVLILSAGAFIQVVIESKTRFIEGLDISVLPAFIMLIGIYGLIQNLICAIVHYKIRNEKRQESLSKFLFAIVISGIVLSTLYVVVGIVCFAQISRLDKAYGKGIYNALKKYKKDKLIKYEIDMLQIAFDCCGSNGYQDWFGINWIDHNYLVNKKGIHMDSKVGYTNDDVPFSCCSATAKRPCIHHHVHDNHVHYNYDYKVETTLNRLGCKQALTMYYGHVILSGIGILILSTAFFQIVLVLVTRLVQTSLVTAIQDGDPTDKADGYLFKSKAKKDKKDKAGKPLLGDDSSGDEANEEVNKTKKSKIPPIPEGDAGNTKRKSSLLSPVQEEPIYDEIKVEPTYVNIDSGKNTRRNSKELYTSIVADVPKYNVAADEPIYANIGTT